MIHLELLAPARDINIGIAAINCGADAVYIAGPSFGARQAAGNSVEDIKKLCDYAHLFGVRIFVTLNTIIYDSELDEALKLAEDVKAAGADALIIQDLALTKVKGIPLHASTQCAIRSAEDAKLYESLGFSRIILERQLSLERIQEIRNACNCEIEFFVHGALCVSYSGNCYLSQKITGRSANRGACAQPCRSRYDLVNEKGELVRDDSGRPLAKNKTLLSLKDYNLINSLDKLAEAGVESFKIEGRLKNISYVKNVVSAYSERLNALIEKYPHKYSRASFGQVHRNFTPILSKTFNRSYTDLFINNTRGNWACLEAAKSLGEKIGTVTGIRKLSRDEIEIRLRLSNPNENLNNGDGFSFISDKGEENGFRADICKGNIIFSHNVEGLKVGKTIFRNLDTAFEKELAGKVSRLVQVDVELKFYTKNNEDFYTASATREDGECCTISNKTNSEYAQNRDRLLEMLDNQISKTTDIYSFRLKKVDAPSQIPFLTSAQINEIRRLLADVLIKKSIKKIELKTGTQKAIEREIEAERGSKKGQPLLEAIPWSSNFNYTKNVSNELSKKIYASLGVKYIEPAYELSPKEGAELMRSKYCIRHELGICLKTCSERLRQEKLFIANNGGISSLIFDCNKCEMIVK